MTPAAAAILEDVPDAQVSIGVGAISIVGSITTGNTRARPRHARLGEAGSQQLYRWLARCERNRPGRRVAQRQQRETILLRVLPEHGAERQAVLLTEACQARVRHDDHGPLVRVRAARRPAAGPSARCLTPSASP